MKRDKKMNKHQVPVEIAALKAHLIEDAYMLLEAVYAAGDWMMPIDAISLDRCIDDLHHLLRAAREVTRQLEIRRELSGGVPMCESH